MQASRREAIFEATADGVLVHDAQGAVLQMNQAHRQLIGLEADPDFLARSLRERVCRLKTSDEHGHPIPEEDSASQRVLRGEVLRGPHAADVLVHTLDGREVWVGISGAPIRGPDGQITGAVLISHDVTARRQLEQHVQEQASQLEAIFEALADGVAVYDREGQFVRANTALRHLLGFETEAGYTTRPLDERAQRLQLYDAQGEPLSAEQWPHWRVLRGEIFAGASAMEGGVRTLDGRQLWISITGAPMRTPDGQVTGTVLITRDVTARRALERHVAEQASQLEAIFEAQADPVVVYDQRRRLVRGNRAWEDLVHRHADLRGLTADPVFVALPVADQVDRLNQQIWDERGRVIPTEDLPTSRALRGETVTGEHAIDERVHSPDGRELQLSVSAAPVRNGEGDIIGAVVVGRDVTARRQLERLLAEREQQYRTLVEHSPDVITRFDQALRHLYVSPRAEAALGIPARERLGKTYADLGLPESLYGPWERALEQVLATGEPCALDITSPFGDGDEQTHYYRVRYVPESGADGSVQSVLSIASEITELKRTEQRLADQERLFRTLVEHSPDIIARFDRELRYLYVSPAICRVSSVPPEDFLGKTNAELGWPEAVYGPAQRAMEQVFQTGQPITLEERNAPVRDPETDRYYRAQILPEFAADGHVESVLAVTTDITELKHTERALRAANAAIETARQEEERRKQIAESLRDVLALLNSTRSSQEVLQYIVGQVEELLASAAAVIYGPDHLMDGPPPEALASALCMQASSGLRLGGRRVRPHQHLPFAHAAVQRALEIDRPVGLYDGCGGASAGDARGHANGNAAIPLLHATLPAPYQALLIVPIRVHDGLYGCLLLFYTQPRSFAAEDVARTQLYADQVAQAITNARLQAHLEREAAAAERNRLAREVHDTVTQDIFSANLIAESLLGTRKMPRAQAEAGLQQLHALTQSAQAGLRALLLELRPGELEHSPLGDALQKLGAAMSTRAGVPITVDADSNVSAELAVPAAVKVAFYRIAQEALMNAVKYATACTISVRLRTRGRGWIELVVSDDGQGFDARTIPTGHFGLAIMRERAQTVGARVHVRSTPGQGTQVVVGWRSCHQATAPDPEEDGEE
jgi:PAS domain S-box-containing protein